MSKVSQLSVPEVCEPPPSPEWQRPESRGLRVGSRLLEHAERTANELGLRGLSLIVSDANRDARRLYERLGYREVASLPMVKEQWQNPGENWVLMIRGLRD